MTSAARLAAPASAAYPFAPGRAGPGPAHPPVTGGNGWRRPWRLGHLRLRPPGRSLPGPASSLGGRCLTTFRGRAPRPGCGAWLAAARRRWGRSRPGTRGGPAGHLGEGILIVMRQRLRDVPDPHRAAQRDLHPRHYRLHRPVSHRRAAQGERASRAVSPGGSGRTRAGRPVSGRTGGNRSGRRNPVPGTDACSAPPGHARGGARTVPGRPGNS